MSQGHAQSAAPAKKARRTTAVAAPHSAAAATAHVSGGKTTTETINVVSTGVHAAKARLKKVPGNFAVIDAKDVERGRASTLEDALAYQPGIYAQATSGSTANKISIRGSGLGVFYGGYSLGMEYLIDGLTVSGVGGFQEDRLNNTGYQRTEVLYGANAFEYAATSLGGAINFVTNTGFSAPGLTLHAEGGSFGSSREEISEGGTFGNNHAGDYYVTVARTDRQGYQADTRTYRTDAVINLGYRITDRFSVRLIGRWDDGETHYGGLLTLAQIKANPAQNPNNWGERPTEAGMVGLKGTYQIDDRSSLEYGVSYNNYSLFNNKDTTEPQLWRSIDVNNSLRYLRNDVIFGRSSDTTIVISDVHMVGGDARYYNIADPATWANRSDWAPSQRVDFSGSHDTVVAVGNTLKAFDRTWLTTGLSAMWIYRDVRITDRAVPNSVPQSSETYNALFLAPRIGLRYELLPNLDVFTNFSRSVDAPVTWEYEDTDGSSSPYNSSGSVGRLEAQRAYTIEVGIRGTVGPFAGSLTAYRSWLHDELLTVVAQRATATTSEIDTTSNASPTIHQGIEAGLQTKLLDLRHNGDLSFRQAFTVNDFYYVDDPSLGHNQLPSLPRWVYQADLQYQHPSGFYADLNFRANSSYYVDYANTLKAPSYGVFGLKLGYDAPGGRWSTFLDFHNLADKHYVTAAYTSYNLKSADSAVFYPGDGFSVFGGVTLHFPKL